MLGFKHLCFFLLNRDLMKGISDSNQPFLKAAESFPYKHQHVAA